MNGAERTTEAKCHPGTGQGAAALARSARLAAGLALGLVLLPDSGSCWAQASAPLRLKATQEIAPFRLTGFDGYMVTRYLHDESSSSGQPGSAAASRARQSNLSEEIFLNTHSYVYHPALLSLDLGGGPVIDKSKYDSDGFVTNSKRQMFNLSGRATILRDKPYTGVLYYDRRNQTQSMGPAQVMLTESTRSGFDFSLRGPFSPIPAQVNFTRSENQGTGAEQVIEDRIDQLRLKMETNVGKWGVSTFQYLGTRQDSVSGSTGLPIQASSSTNDGVNLDTRLKFGARNEYDLNNVVSANSNRYTAGLGTFAQLQDLRFGLDLRARHSEALQTFGRYSFSTSKQGVQESTANSVGAGGNYRYNEEISGSLAGRGERNQTSQFNSSLYGMDASAQYRKALPLGEITAGYSVAYSQHDQQAMAAEARIIGERVTLASTTAVTLMQDQIALGSVVVSNLTRTQVFVEGLDYMLTQVGLRLRIQRVIGGNILDGQEVLTDYAYASGGTYAISQLDNTVNLNWALKSYLGLFARHLDSAFTLNSGSPTAPLNPAKSTMYGSRAELPLSFLYQEFLVGGRAEREVRSEVISPYTRSSLDGYAQMDLPYVRSGGIRAGMRRMQVDYDYNPLQGVKLSAYDLRLWSRLGWGIDLSAEASRFRDTGAPLVREGASASLKAQWRRRKLLWTFDLTRVRDAQGAAERTRTYGQILLRRDF